jgi:tight adherence protein B
VIPALLGTAVAALVAPELLRLAARPRVRRRLQVPGAGGATSSPLPTPVRAALYDAGIDDHDRTVARWLGAVAVTGLVATVSPGGRILLVLVAVAPPVAVRLARGRLARQRCRQLPEALDAVAAGLRGGHGLAGAIGGAAAVGPPLGPELATISGDVDAGRPLAEAVDRWRATAADPHTALAGAALSVAATVGGPGARAVDGAAASLRDRLAADAEAAALATQAQASALVLTLAPLGFAVLLTSLDPTAARFLLGTPAGWLCINSGLGLDAVGAWWMSRLVRRAR